MSDPLTPPTVQPDPTLEVDTQVAATCLDMNVLIRTESLVNDAQAHLALFGHQIGGLSRVVDVAKSSVLVKGSRFRKRLARLASRILGLP
jgi:hypothetical protein